MHELMKKTCEALEDIEHSGSFNVMDTADRRVVSELVDLKKNILKAQKLEDEMEGYSEDDGRGSSYASRGKHYVRGHYSRDGGRDGMMHDGGYSSRRRDSMGRYSKADARADMMDHLEMAVEAAPEEYKDAFRSFMRKMENA